MGDTHCKWVSRLVSVVLALLLAAGGAAWAQEAGKSAATFNERFLNQQFFTQMPPEHITSQATPDTGPRRTARKEHKRATPAQVASTKGPTAHIVVEPRSFLDAGTEPLPGDRKFLNYAFPPMR